MTPVGRPPIEAGKRRDRMTPGQRGLRHINVPESLRDALKAGAHAKGMSLAAYLEWLHTQYGAAKE